MDLLARLSSTGMVKSPVHMTPAKFEALEHMEGKPSRAVVLVRERGKDLPSGWEQLWEMVEAGWVSNTAMKRDDALGMVYFTFQMTDVGYQKWLAQKGIEILPPPPASVPRKPRRRKGPAAKTGKPGL